ncbi:MAG: hypothetical protein JWP57_4370 [Spirosoma sp.]|nr:hypothetical protein [Spirosoma sp.]
MPYPDNFDSAAYAATYGDEDFDRRQETANEVHAEDHRQADELVADFTALISKIQGMEFDRFPFAGFDPEHVVAQLREWVDVREAA